MADRAYEYTQEELDLLALAQHEQRAFYKTRVRAHDLLAIVLGIAMVAAALYVITQVILSVNLVANAGMEPAILSQHYAVSNRLAYAEKDPQRGDVIIANNYMARIVGLPGDTIEFYAGHIYINNQLVVETYLDEGTLTFPVANNTAFIIPENAYFVLNDQRSCYDDSRQGFVIQREAIFGKVMFIL